MARKLATAAVLAVCVSLLVVNTVANPPGKPGVQGTINRAKNLRLGLGDLREDLAARIYQTIDVAYVKESIRKDVNDRIAEVREALSQMTLNGIDLREFGRTIASNVKKTVESNVAAILEKVESTVNDFAVEELRGKILAEINIEGLGEKLKANVYEKIADTVGNVVNKNLGSDIKEAVMETVDKVVGEAKANANAYNVDQIVKDIKGKISAQTGVQFNS